MNDIPAAKEATEKHYFYCYNLYISSNFKKETMLAECEILNKLLGIRRAGALEKATIL